MIRITLPTAPVLRIPWGTRVEQERRNRIRVSVLAYAYEFEDAALVPDAEYDDLARRIDTSIVTGRLDKFFQQHYSADTGMWIRLHPELHLVAECYRKYFTYKG